MNKVLIQRQEALAILSSADGPLFKPIPWRTELIKRAGADHCHIDMAGDWEHENRKYTVRFSLSLEAEPDPRAYLLVAIDDRFSNLWMAHSRWVPLWRAGRDPDVRAFFGGRTW